jgi:DNA processing protein
MTPAAALAWSHLNVLNAKRFKQLAQRFGDLDEALLALDEDLLTSLGCRAETVRTALTRLAAFNLEATERELAQRGITLLSVTDDAYPRRLRETADAPPFLYVRGPVTVLAQPGVALVGTRDMSPYGRQLAQACAATCVQAKLTTISGLADGIDGEVARETLRLQGHTVAVLGHGLRQIYPAGHARLAEAIVQGGGCIVSEYALDVEPERHSFPARNRIIAGLSLATVVLEAAAESGALHTARFALDEGRDILAAPGQLFDPQFAGCHRLVATGQARLLTDPQDILEVLGMQPAQATSPQSTYTAQSPAEERTLQALTSVPQDLDLLSELTQLDPATLGATLTMLELGGAARSLGGGLWVRH